ncbi:MAG: arylsulfotransferase family protein [Gaiellaceae bacterium]
MRVTLALVTTVALTACGGRAAPALPGALHTVHDVSPPRLTILHPASRTAPGLIFVAEKGGKDRPSGPVIADNRGRIVWYHQVPHGLEATDFRAQTYRGGPVLTWWQGTISKAGVGRGEYVVYDDAYRELLTLKAGHDLDGDLHEFQLTPRGTAYVPVYHEVPADLRSVGGPQAGYVYDSVVQELDLQSGDVVFEWHSVGHVPFTESLQAHREPAKHATRKRPLDYFHVNSVKDAPGGNIIISARNTSTLYLLRRDGSIAWRLGGKRSDFGPPAAVKFRFQHDAHLRADGTLTLFDNGAIPKLEPFTRPLVLKLDLAARHVSAARAFVHPQKISSPFEGNLQTLDDGGALVGWGGVRKVTEFTPDAKVRFELKLPYGDTYRAYRLPWSGRPGGRPSVAVSGNRVYASWNGKSDIASWEVLTGRDADHLTPSARHDWAGLETAIRIGQSPGTVAVRALDASGRTLGVSETITP